MIDDMNVMVVVQTNLGYLCDIEVVMGLTCIMHYLKVMHVFIKFAQLKDSFVCDFVTSMKMCCVEFYNMYMLIQRRSIPRTS
jgi:hypothetical protein